jgi:bifunctional UDP-N-acetylglucosamine pyrophosphorylase/glucosamine-1-phosphate N-acetyltransferase
LRSINLPKGSWLDIGLPWNLLDANKIALASLQTSIEGNVEDGVQIHGSVKISKGARIRFGTYIEGPVWIGSGSDIGPNCYLRPSTSIGANVRIGNACEIKNSIILDSTHIAHLSYVGDSIIGERVNLGAGTITANIRFDKKNVKVEIKDKRIDSGKRKFGAIIGDDVQTGINVSLMPGVKIGSSAWISPGLTVNENVESGLFLKTKS